MERRMRWADLRGAPTVLVLLGLVGLVWAVFLPSEPPVPTYHWIGVGVLTALGLVGAAAGLLIRKRS